MKILFRSAIAAVVFAGLVGIAQPAAAQTASVDVRVGHRQHYRHGHRMHARLHRQYARYDRQYARSYRSYARHYRAPVVVYQQRLQKKRYLRWY